MDNTIIEPITADGNVGFDAYSQLWAFKTRNDGSEFGTLIYDTRGRNCPLCGKDWEASSQGMSDQYFDRDIENLVHRSCKTRLVAYDERKTIITVLTDVVLSNVALSKDDHSYQIAEIENQYGGAWNTPWYEIRINGFKPTVIEIGFRKRVWSITAKYTSITRLKLIEEAFKEDDSTKGMNVDRYYIHAWTYKRLNEIFSTMFTIITEPVAVGEATPA